MRIRLGIYSDYFEHNVWLSWVFDVHGCAWMCMDVHDVHDVHARVKKSCDCLL